MFGTIGVNVDLIKASWNALIEAYQYALSQHSDFVAELESASSTDADSSDRKSGC
jgi:hypothetical protein